MYVFIKSKVNFFWSFARFSLLVFPCGLNFDGGMGFEWGLLTYLVRQVMVGGLGRVGLLLHGFFDSSEGVSRSR